MWPEGALFKKKKSDLTHSEKEEECLFFFQKNFIKNHYAMQRLKSTL